MRMVTRQEIEKSMDIIHNLSEEETYEWIHVMQEEQPFLQIYVAAICERGDFEDDNDIDAFTNLAIIIWHAMRTAAQGPLAEVKGYEIDEREEALIEHFDSVEGEAEADVMNAVQTWLEDDPQRPLLEFLLMTLMSPENPYEVTEESTGMLLVYLKVIAECLDHASPQKVAKAPAKKVLHPGQCMRCQAVLNKANMTNHLKKCKEKAGGSNERGVEMFHLLIESVPLPMYWLHVEIPGTKTLADLDAFLRGIWLECCGHMSCFTIEGTHYVSSPMEESIFGRREKSMRQKIHTILRMGMKFKYAYDYGSTTDLKLRVVDIQKQQVKKSGVTLLARNQPPPWECTGCGKPATQVQAGGWGLDPDFLYCDDCAADADEDDLLPIVNSPRTGVCGYCG